VAFDTVPWQTAEEAVKARSFFDEWREHRCLKTLSDYEDWEDFYLTKSQLDRIRKLFNSARLPVQVTDEGSLGILKRMFLRAYVQGAWGLQRTLNSYVELRDAMDFAGCAVSAHDAKNGNKGKVIDNIVPRTPRTEDAVRKLMLVFDGLDVGKVFIPDLSN